MIDIIFNAIKFILSEDVRKNAGSLLESIRKSPEWQKSLCSLTAHITKSHSEQAYLISDIISEKLLTLRFQAEAIAASKVVFHELTKNAFLYGCKKSGQIIKITIDMNDSYVSLCVENSGGFEFDFHKLLITAKQQLESDPSRRQGRGLLRIADLSDEISQDDNYRSVKSVIYRDRVSMAIQTSNTYTIIKWLSGIYNPSATRRLLALTLRHRNTDLILDFEEWSLGTNWDTVVIDLSELYKVTNKLVVAIVPEGDSIAYLPHAVIAYSMEEALLKIGIR